jgi:hypothetical protein
VAARPFFPPGPADELIIDCYRLAARYAIDPDIFLAKPLSSIERHLKYTRMLMERQMPPEDDG